MYKYLYVSIYMVVFKCEYLRVSIYMSVFGLCSKMCHKMQLILQSLLFMDIKTYNPIEPLMGLIKKCGFIFRKYCSSEMNGGASGLWFTRR